MKKSIALVALLVVASLLAIAHVGSAEGYQTCQYPNLCVGAR